MTTFINTTRALLAAFSPGKAHHTRNTFAASVPLASLAFAVTLSVLASLALAPKAEAQFSMIGIGNVFWTYNGWSTAGDAVPTFTASGGNGGTYVMRSSSSGNDWQVSFNVFSATNADLSFSLGATFLGTFNLDTSAGVQSIDVTDTGTGLTVHVAIGTGAADSLTIPNGRDAALVFGLGGNDTIGPASSSDTTPSVVFGGNGNDNVSVGTNANTSYLHGDWIPGFGFFTGADVLVGAQFPDFLAGGPGNDQLTGLDGNDVLLGQGGNEALMFGNGGDDFMDGGAGTDDMFGGSGNDTMIGGTGNDTMFGEDGEDHMSGGTGDDWMEGGVDNDQMFGDDNIDTMFGDDGEDHMFGGIGNDIMDGGNDADQMFGEDNDDTMHGGFGDDIMDGGAGRDDMFGEDGSDSMFGDTGDDLMRGGDGDDDMHGGAGDDAMDGGDGADVIGGDEGRDFLFDNDGTGGDSLVGGDDNDLLWSADGVISGSDTIDGGAGTDTFWIDMLDTSVSLETTGTPPGPGVNFLTPADPFLDYAKWPTPDTDDFWDAAGHAGTRQP